MRRPQKSYTDGPILKSLLSLAVPIVLANLLHTAYQLIDTFWVGRLGAEAVAAVSLSFPIIFLMISLGGGLSIAGSVLVAHHTGRKEPERVNHISGQTLMMMVFIALLISVSGYFLTPLLIGLMNPEPVVFEMAVSYLQISFIGLTFLFSFFVFQSLMRGVGNVTVPLYLVLGTVLLNLILDPLLILGYGPIPGFGVVGAALATIATQGLAAIIGVAMLFTGRYEISVHFENLKPDRALLKQMLNLGFPASIEQSTRALGLMFMTLLVATFDTVAIAAFGVGIRVLSFVIIPAIGLSMATSTFVGQNMGAGKTDRAEHAAGVSMGFIFVVLTAVGAGFFTFSQEVAAAFVPGEPEVIATGALFIRIVAFAFGFIGIQQILNGVFRGSGKTLISMVLALVSLWVLRFPIAYLLSYHTSLAEQGIWWAFPIADVIAATIAWLWYKRGSWKIETISKEEQIVNEISEEVITEEGLQ